MACRLWLLGVTKGIIILWYLYRWETLWPRKRSCFHQPGPTKLFSFAGTLNDCYDAYYKQTYQGKTFSSLSLAVYDAEYQKENYTITIEYPAMEYTVYGETIRHSRFALTDVAYDPIVIPGSDLLTYYCEMLGWIRTVTDCGL